MPLSDRSVMVWIVTEYGHEYETPLKVWDNKRRAEQHCSRLAETKDSRVLGFGFCGYRVLQVPMILCKEGQAHD